MINNIIFIALLCVYSIILIALTIKAPQYMLKIKSRLKQRKIQKTKKRNAYIRKVVRDYLKELSDD